MIGFDSAGSSFLSRTRVIGLGAGLVAGTVTLSACADEAGEADEEPLVDENRDALPDDMQGGMPVAPVPLRRLFVEGEWRAGWIIGSERESPRVAAEAVSQVYVFCRDSEFEMCPMAAPPVGQNVFATIPDDEDYSPYWEVVRVRVPEDYEPDAIKSVATIDRSGYETETLPMVVNCPLHGHGAALRGNGLEGAPSISVASGWYDGWRIYYWNFGLVPLADDGNAVESTEGYWTYRSGNDLPEDEISVGRDVNGNGVEDETNIVLSVAGEGFSGRVVARRADVDGSVALALDDADPSTSGVQDVTALEMLLDEGAASLRDGGEAYDVWNFGLRPLSSP